MKSIKTNPNSAKDPDKGKIVNKLYCIFSVLARISKGQGATSEKGTFKCKRWLKKGTSLQ